MNAPVRLLTHSIAAEGRSDGANVEAPGVQTTGIDCPKCGGRLTDYRLGDRVAVGCETCGYVGIDAEHRGEPTDRETWGDALRRFRGREPGVPTDASGGDREAEGDDPTELAVGHEEPTQLAVEGDTPTDLAVPASGLTDGSVAGDTDERTDESES